MEVKDYFDAIKEGTQRTRSIIYILITASIVSFIADWNVSSSWLDSRIQLRENILHWYPFTNSIKKQLSKDSIIPFEKANIVAIAMGADLVSLKDSSFFKAKIIQEISELDKIKTSRSFITIPVFNVDIDINDLSIFTGITFIFILFMLRVSLWREWANIVFIFKFAEEKKQLDEVYQYLSMAQVLSVPSNKYTKVNKVWANFSKYIIMIPFFIQLYNCWENYMTFSKGAILDESLTWAVSIISIICLLIMLALTINCFKFSVKYKDIWMNTFSKL